MHKLRAAKVQFFSVYSNHCNSKLLCTFAVFQKFCWRDARVVDWGGLENRCTLTGTQGSNPCFSATYR